MINPSYLRIHFSLQRKISGHQTGSLISSYKPMSRVIPIPIILSSKYFKSYLFFFLYFLVAFVTYWIFLIFLLYKNVLIFLSPFFFFFRIIQFLWIRLTWFCFDFQDLCILPRKFQCDDGSPFRNPSHQSCDVFFRVYLPTMNCSSMFIRFCRVSDWFCALLYFIFHNFSEKIGLRDSEKRNLDLPIFIWFLIVSNHLALVM